MHWAFEIFAAIAATSVSAQILETRNTFKGFLVDRYCWGLPGHIALDSANLETNPENHQVYCMRDVSVCRENGFGILQLDKNGELYSLNYVFDSEGNNLSLDLVDTVEVDGNVRIVVEGDLDSDGMTIAVSALVLDDGTSDVKEEGSNNDESGEDDDVDVGDNENNSRGEESFSFSMGYSMSF
mmetsp:Transcript_55670/g.95885  ORF Transcript_55670/g.95885 Transcript_55670/m.95885 type:complete len:183 (-) Transcript_55670:208-756(-)